jgi:hypothetical protein
MKDIFIKISSLYFFYRWHPEVALRYLPIVDDLNKDKSLKKIIEIGSGGLGITPYLNRNITGFDIAFSPPFHSKLKRIIGNAVNISLPKNSFDAVLSVDTLEHMNKISRIQAISEMFKIAKKKIIIAVPSGNDSQKQDEELDSIFYQRFGKKYHFLDEQIHLGLPEEKEMINAIKLASAKWHKKFHLRTYNNENLKLRKFLMLGFMTKNVFVNFCHRKIMLFFIPILKLINHKPTYRKIFIIDL